MTEIYFSDQLKCRKILCVLIYFFLAGTCVQAHTTRPGEDSVLKAKKSIRAIRISSPPKIDGIMDEAFWKDCPVATGFVEYTPVNGTPPMVNTVVRFAYDDEALYIFAILYDPHPDSICHELGRRDQVESLTTDYISFDILPYNDGLNMYEFKVTPAGLQNDCKYSAVGTDINWDAVWENTSKITAEGWVAELKLPFSALRLPRVKDQVWGFNMWRNFHRRNEYSTWSLVNNTDNNIFAYYGTLTGITDIKPPVRLSLSPYISGYVQKTPENKKPDFIFRGGLDLRYGINESYTLDMMLIPDFGQVQPDDQVLNLTPFEIRYDERRQFFTEATEMFNKCGIFYTRRIGSVPRKFYSVPDSLRDHEMISKNPEETRIINATKISGRNAKGLGIGFFNAMTTNTWATLTDTITGLKRKVSTQPFTNYNVMVIDQNLKHNSYITLINTNYLTPDDHYSANVTGVETQLYEKSSVYALFGKVNLSQKYTEHLTPVFGHEYVVAFLKSKGKFQFQLVRQEIDARYDPNDMGFLTNNNESVNQLRLNWLELDPFWKILNNRSEFVVNHIALTRPYSFKSLKFTADNSTTFKNFWTVYFETNIYPYGYRDFYEPRVWGKVYKIPAFFDVSMNPATNPRKVFRVSSQFTVRSIPSTKDFLYSITLVPRIRFSDKFTVSLSCTYNFDNNDRGWVNTETDSLSNTTIFFGRRDLTTVNNILSVKYIFNPEASITLRARHYWSKAKYLEYFTLNDRESLDHSETNQDADINFNAFNIDLEFVWYFAPGSQLKAVWMNNISRQDQAVSASYWDNLNNTWTSPQANSLSLSILYYLDYQKVKKALSRKGHS